MYEKSIYIEIYLHTHTTQKPMISEKTILEL